MQYFDFKELLLSLLFFLGTCQMSEPTSMTLPEEESTIKLTEPKDEGEEDYSKVFTKLTLLLLGGERIYAYEGNNINKGSFHSLKTISKIIQQSKNKFSAKEFIVVVKPASKATYDITVNVLDEMLINKIERHAIVDLNEEEKKFINTAN